MLIGCRLVVATVEKLGCEDQEETTEADPSGLEVHSLDNLSLVSPFVPTAVTCSAVTGMMIEELEWQIWAEETSWHVDVVRECWAWQET